MKTVKCAESYGVEMTVGLLVFIRPKHHMHLVISSDANKQGNRRPCVWPRAL